MTEVVATPAVTLVEGGGGAPAIKPIVVPAAAATTGTPVVETVKATPGTLIEDSGAADDLPLSAPSTWPNDWREQIAGKDEATLKALGRYASPKGIWDKARSLEKKLSAGAGERPGIEDATAVAEWRKGRGVPEKPEDYFAGLKLPQGQVLGDADKPLVESFAKAMHDEDITPKQMSRAVSWLKEQERLTADAVSENDDRNRVTSRDLLRDEYGADYKGNLNAVSSMYKDMPEPVRQSLFAARAPDGKLIGDHPEVIKWMVETALALNPAAKQTSGQGDPKLALSELADLRKLAGKQDSAYWVGPQAKANQARFNELLAVEAGIKQRKAA